MAKRTKLNQKQFAQIVGKMHGVLFLGDSLDVDPSTDCSAVLAFIQAAQAIYDRDCAILRKPVAKKK